MASYGKDIFKQRRNSSLMTFAIILGIYFFFAGFLNFDLWDSVSQIPGGFGWMANNFAPSEASTASTFVWRIVTTMTRTFVIAVAATVVASVAALIAAVFGSEKTGIHKAGIYFIRLFAMVFRNIPLIAWAIILLFSFRQNEFTGFLALFFGTFGYLTRTFVEVIDEMSDGVLEALKASGATYFQVVFQGVLPMISSQLVSWVLFMIESNIREATLVGILTGTGIGFMFNIQFGQFRFPQAGMVLFFIILVVMGLEMLSNKIRRLII